MSRKPIPQPVWWKNTFFWIAGLLLIVAIYGLLRGDDTIRDPGQRRENMLPLIYLGGAVVMLINGLLSHRLTVQHYAEEHRLAPESSTGEES